MTTATDSGNLQAATGGAPFAGMTDDELDELRRCVLHSLELNALEEIELTAQLRILRAEMRLRNAMSMESLTDSNRLKEQ